MQAMISKGQIKAIRALHRKKERLAQGLFLVEGDKSVAEVLAWPSARVELLVCGPEFNGPDAAKVEAAVERQVWASEAEMGQVSLLERNVSCLAVVAVPPVVAMQGPGRWVLALDGIRDPGNLGTLLRLADWFGMAGVLASEDTAEWTNPKAVQASMGSFLRLQPRYGTLIELCQGLPVYGAFLQGENAYSLSKLEPGVLVIGSEAHGISEAVAAACGRRITIPRFGGAESLNAAVAGGILMFAARGE